MPELPEVETVRRGLAPLLSGRHIVAAVVRQPRLRQPVPRDLSARLSGKRVDAVTRRGKYLLVRAADESLLIHLGMSGRLHVLETHFAAGTHDHVDLLLENNIRLRFHDPRRFGLMLLCPTGTHDHPLLARIGPEPLGHDFSGEYLYRLSRGRHLAVKNFIMDSHVVAGVGNIYASEALFGAGIRPTRAAGRIGLVRYDRLAESIRTTLNRAIACGGTTLRDFIGVGGQPGYFAQQLYVYGRTSAPCLKCGTVIQQRRIGQRSSFFCPRCQAW